MSDILQAARSYYGLADTDSCTTQLYTNQAGQACVAFEIPLSNEDFAAIVQRMQNMKQHGTQPDTTAIEGPTVEAMREAYNALSKAERGRYGSFSRYMAESSTGIIDVYTGEPYKTPEFEEIKTQPSGNPGELESKQVLEDIEQLPRFVGAVEAAWVAGYYHAGYTNDLAYAHMKASEYFKFVMEESKDNPERQVVHVDAPEEPEPVSMDAVWISSDDCSEAQRIHSSDYRIDPQRPGQYTYYEYLIQWAMLTDEQKQKAQEAKG